MKMPAPKTAILAGILVLPILMNISESHAASRLGDWRGAETTSYDSFAGKLGVGLDMSALNFGLGPVARLWLTDNIGGQAGYAAIGGFTGFNFRGLYKFNKEIPFGGTPYRPYIGVGYTSLTSKETLGIAEVEVKGGGPAFFGGVEGNLSALNPNLYWTTEFMYAAFDLEGTATINDGFGNSVSYTAKSDAFSGFSIGLSAVYYFDLPRMGNRSGAARSRSRRTGKRTRREDSGLSGSSEGEEKPRWHRRGSPAAGGDQSW